jgi:hypothetical protein
VFQFPVVYDTMTVLRQSGLSAAQPRRTGAMSTSASRAIAEMIGLDRPSSTAARAG